MTRKTEIKQSGGAAGDVLGWRALNRALLARQMLLERANMTPLAALEHLVGLQAQVPTDPYFGLWSRLSDLDPAEVSDLIVDREAVRIASLRGTLHLLTADDALELRPLVQPILTRILNAQAFGRDTRTVDVDALVAAGRAAVEETPMTLAELRPILAQAFPGIDPRSLSYAFHYSTPLVQLPPRGLWGKSGRARVTTLEAWLDRPLAEVSLQNVVLRYLAAFGPASVRDAQAWSGLRRLDTVFDALRPRLITFRSEAGRELFDLPEAPRPDPDVPVPPRFLPVYDNVVLGLAHRDRIIRGGPRVPPPENVNVRTFLVDGLVAGFWKIVESRKHATLTIEPFGELTSGDEAALAAEGEELLRFATRAEAHEIAFAPSP